MKSKLIFIILVICFVSVITVSAETDNRSTVRVPALMYHCIDNNANDVTIAPENFRKHIETIVENGYTPVSLQELVDYVDRGRSLPEKPVCITIDDGYLDNYLNAYPILKEFGCKATIFAIGSSVGKSTYKNTGIAIFPHFDYTQAKEMVESGLISVQSHTFDMHQSKTAENTAYPRETLMQLPGEGFREYVVSLENDIQLSKKMLEAEIGEPVIGLAYPRGMYNGTVEFIMRKNGIRVTFATSTGVNYINKDDANSLYSLNRYNMHDGVSAEQLLEWLNEE